MSDIVSPAQHTDLERVLTSTHFSLVKPIHSPRSSSCQYAADTRGFCGCQPVVCGDIYIGSLSTGLIVTAPLDYSMHNQGSAQMTRNTLHNDGHDELVQAKWELQGVYSMTRFFLSRSTC